MWIVVQYLCAVAVLAIVGYLSIREILQGLYYGSLQYSWHHVGLLILSGIGMWYVMHHTPFVITPV
jgi:hypothetical protein